MTGAMYASIAGLKTHMNKLNVIGNNVANVNTNAYKSQRAVFRDALYTMYSSGSDGSVTTGGKNPSQIGYGSQLASIDLNMSSANFAPGNEMDCMLDGDGFFLVGGKDIAATIDPTNPTSFKSLTLTRVGDFTIDAGGYLVDGQGNCVYGFMVVGNDLEGQPIVSDQLVPIRMPRTERVAVSLSQDNYGEEIEVADDMEEGTDYEYRTVIRYPVVARDGEGNPITGSDLLNNGDGAEMTNVRLEDYEPAADEDADEDEDVENALAIALLDNISFDQATGRISGTLKGTSEWVNIGFLAIGNVTNPNGVSHTSKSYYMAGDGAGDLSITMLGGESSTIRTVGGGYMQYVNGSLAQADEEDGELNLSDKAAIGSAGKTVLYTGGLETSNVDLATEISEMITTQRGYQANTRIITVTDSMLEELVNMKR